MKKNEKGTVIIISAIGVATLFTLGGYLLSSTLSEMTVSSSVDKATKAYYLAESGVNEAIWMLNNDAEWKEGFVAQETGGESWTASFHRENIGEGEYTVVIKNSEPGYGEITSIGKVPFLEKEATRKIKTTVFRGIDSPTHDAAMLTGGSSENISITHTDVTVYNGNIFSNGDLQIEGVSNIKVFDNLDTEKKEGKVIAVQSLNVKKESVIEEYTAICAKNTCDETLCESCPPEAVPSVIVDFDSESETSFLSRAKSDTSCSIICKKEGEENYPCSNNCFLPANEFEELLWEVGEGGEVILENEVTYVDGSLELRAGRTVDVRGVMVVDGNFDIGERYSWVNIGQRDEGNAHFKITPSLENDASGLLVKRKLNIGNYSLKEDTNLEGVVYAGEETKIVSAPHRISIVGAIIARKFSINSLSYGIGITLDNEKVLHGLGYIVGGEVINPNFSSVLQVDHWEEVY